MEREANPGRARLILLVVALGVLLLGLTPYPRAFTRTLRQAEALQLDPSAANAATAHALLGRLLMDEDPTEAAHHFHHAGDEEHPSCLVIALPERHALARALQEEEK